MINHTHITVTASPFIIQIKSWTHLKMQIGETLFQGNPHPISQVWYAVGVYHQHLDHLIFDVLDLIFDIFGDWIFDRYRVIRVPAKSVTHSSRPNLGKIENVHLFLTFNHVQISSLAPAAQFVINIFRWSFLTRLYVPLRRSAMFVTSTTKSIMLKWRQFTFEMCRN